MKRILVDSLDYGTRIGIVENGVLMELIYERKNSMPIIGNVYIGKIVNVLPGMQAAFVYKGREKNAFLYYGDQKDENGNITEIHCTYDPETKAGSGFTGRKVKGTIHWVPAPYAQKAEVRHYENLVEEEKGVYNKEDGSLNLNPNTLSVIKDA